jgi:hypothetical protein
MKKRAMRKSGYQSELDVRWTWGMAASIVAERSSHAVQRGHRRQGIEPLPRGAIRGSFQVVKERQAVVDGEQAPTTRANGNECMRRGLLTQLRASLEFTAYATFLHVRWIESSAYSA